MFVIALVGSRWKKEGFSMADFFDLKYNKTLLVGNTLGKRVLIHTKDIQNKAKEGTENR